MNTLASLGIGLVTGFIGLFGIGTVVALCDEWGITTGKEAGSTYFALLVGGAAALAFFVAGVMSSRYLAIHAGYGSGKVLWTLAGAATALVLATAFVCWTVAPRRGEKPVAVSENHSVQANPALDAQSSFETLFEKTHYRYSPADRAAAGMLLSQRPNLAAELTPALLSTNLETADQAMRAFPYINPIESTLAGPVAVVGEQILGDLRSYRELDRATDEARLLAERIHTRFQGWSEAVAVLQANGSDFRPSLHRIVELTQDITDNAIMPDIARVAGYYANK